MISDTVSCVERPYFLAMAAEIVYSPDAYSFLASPHPNSRKPIATLATAHEAAMPDSNAACATPMVDFGAMNSDIISTPMTMAGTERAATMKSSEVLARKRTVSQVVTAR
jgi:hypothetical protein